MEKWGKLLARSFPHTPFKNSLTRDYRNKLLVYKQTVGACLLARFCSRERVGTTKTPRAKKFVKIKNKEYTISFTKCYVPPHPFKKARTKK